MKRFVLIGVCVSALTACHVENEYYGTPYQSTREVYVDSHRHRHHHYYDDRRPQVHYESRNYHTHPSQRAESVQENTTIIVENPSSPYAQQLPQNNVHRHP